MLAYMPAPWIRHGFYFWGWTSANQLCVNRRVWCAEKASYSLNVHRSCWVFHFKTSFRDILIISWATAKTAAICIGRTLANGNWWKLLKTHGKRWHLPKFVDVLSVNLGFSRLLSCVGTGWSLVDFLQTVAPSLLVSAGWCPPVIMLVYKPHQLLYSIVFYS